VRNFISSEIHKPYYDLIMDRLHNDGNIMNEYRCIPYAKREKQIAHALWDVESLSYTMREDFSLVEV